MSKYYLKSHVTVDMLRAIGFNDYNYGDMQRYAKEGKTVFANPSDKIILIGETSLNGWDKWSSFPSSYIKDLFELDYVEVREN